MSSPLRERRRRELAATLAVYRKNPALMQKAISVASDLASGYADAWGSQRAPASADLIGQYKGIAYSCAVTNAQAVARVPRRLYVTTRKGEAEPSKLWKYAPLSKEQKKHVTRHVKGMALEGNVEVEEVLDHPLLDLLKGTQKTFGAYTLAELTDLYQEMDGNAYWRLERNLLGVPTAIYILQSHLVSIEYDSATGFPTLYRYGSKDTEQQIDPKDIVHFKFPSLMDPYGRGWSPARACWESLNIMNKDHSFAASYMDNRIRPDAIISPKSSDDFLSQPQERRLERTLQRKFRQGGAGGTMVWGSALDITPLSFNSKDMEMLARYGATKVEVMNAYGVPPAMLDSMKSRAELSAAQAQHARQAVSPRVLRQDEQLNLQLVSLFSDRLFFLSDDAVPADVTLAISLRESNLKTGLTTINEERLEDGRDEVEWGNEPWLPTSLAQITDRPVPMPGGLPPAEGEAPEDEEEEEPEEDMEEDVEDEEEDEDEKALHIPTGEEYFYRTVLSEIRKHPQGITPWDVLECMGGVNGHTVADVNRAARYWERLGLLRG